MNEIKFRVWNDKSWSYFKIGEPFGTWALLMYDDHCINGRSFQQFTGLKDNGGNEIYEGDIMRHREFKFNVVVEWNSNGYWTLSGWDFVRTDATLGIVIGNTTQNEDLL